MNVVSQKLFKANAVMDCISSRMDTVFGMPKASEILHHRIAHKFPLLADIITEYLGKRNYAVYYGLIGVFFGTVISRLFYVVFRPLLTYRFLFGCSVVEYYKKTFQDNRFLQKQQRASFY